jgi:hypothetical protein
MVCSISHAHLRCSEAYPFPGHIDREIVKHTHFGGFDDDEEEEEDEEVCNLSQLPECLFF